VRPSLNGTTWTVVSREFGAEVAYKATSKLALERALELERNPGRGVEQAGDTATGEGASRAHHLPTIKLSFKRLSAMCILRLRLGALELGI
jgi:hypothetical protein